MWIGSSDVAAICGVDKYKGPIDVWYEKVFPSKDWGGNIYTESGDYAEEGLVCFAENRLSIPGGSAIRNAQFKKNDVAPFAANLDAWVPDLGLVIEAKQTGAREEWGRPGTDEIPDRVLMQVHHQMYCSGAVRAIIPVAMGFRGVKYLIYECERNQEIVDHMLSVCQRFWHENVIPKVKPESPPPRLDTLRALERDAEETVNLPQELVDEWLESRRQLAEWRKEKERLDAEILLAMEVEDSHGVRTLAEIGLAKDGYIDYTSGPKGRRSLKWKAEPWNGETS